jgi:hypothetical protein
VNKSNEFERFSDVIRDSKEHHDICEWQNFKLDLSVAFEHRKSIAEHIQDSIPNYKTINGLYSFFDGDKCLYLGKGRPIWKRIKWGAIRPVLGFPGCFVDRGVCWLCDLKW